MQIKYIQDDILNNTNRFIWNPCSVNGFFSLDKVRNSYPYAFSEYIRLIDSPNAILGTTQLVKCRDRTIINAVVLGGACATPDGVKTSFDAVASSFNQLENMIWGKTVCIPVFDFPNWQIISSIIEKECTSIRPKVFTKKINFLSK